MLVIVRALDPAVVQSLRLRGFDFVEQLFPRKYEPLPVGVVAIDDKSLAQYGQWPWSRALVAKLVDKIAAGKPGVLGVDIIFAEPDRLSPGRLVDSDPEIPAPVAGELAKLPTHEAALAEALRKVPTVLAVSAGGQARAHAERAPSRVTMVLESGANPDQFLLTYPDLLGSLPEIAAAESGQGAVDQGPDRDGITRRVPLFVFAGGNLVPDLALEMLRVATGARAVGIVAGANGVKGATLGSFFFPSDRNGRVYPYFMPFYDARFISAADLLDGSYDSGRLQGTAVLLGSSATGLADLSQTPLGLMPGVEVWAQTLESMMTGNLLRRPGFLWRVEIDDHPGRGSDRHLCVALPESADSRHYAAGHRRYPPRLGDCEFRVLEAAARRRLSRAVVCARVRRHAVGELARGRGRASPARGRVAARTRTGSAHRRRAECRAIDPDWPAAAALPRPARSIRRRCLRFDRAGADGGRRPL